MAAVIACRLLRSRASAGRRAPLGWRWSALVGVAGGIVSGLFGVGGAIIAPPTLTGFFGIRQAAAQELALALVAPGSVVALFAYSHAGQVNWRAGIPLAIGALASISAGVAAAHRLPERGLRLMFCGFLAVGRRAAHLARMSSHGGRPPSMPPIDPDLFVWRQK